LHAIFGPSPVLANHTRATVMRRAGIDGEARGRLKLYRAAGFGKYFGQVLAKFSRRFDDPVTKITLQYRQAASD